MYKKIFSSLIVFINTLCIIILISCSDKKDSGHSGITISGNLSSGKSATFFEKLNNFFFKPAYALDPNQVAKVIVFTGDFNNFYIANVSNGKFSVKVDRDKPVGLVFSGANDNFLGYLSLGSAIQSIPLQSAGNDVSEINLETLTGSGNVVEPGHNPIGNEINLTSEEIKSLSQTNTFFGAVIKNPDMDNDGKIDILTNRYYMINMQFDIHAGDFNSSNLTPDMTGINLVMTHLAFVIYDPDANGVWPNTLTFTGPSGSGWVNTPNVYSSVNPIIMNNNTRAMYSPPPGDIPPMGNYTVNYGSLTLSFNLPDQSNAEDNIVVIVPTVVLNEDGTINKITWKYKVAGNNDAEKPNSVISSKYIAIQITGTGAQCNIDTAHGSNLLYFSQEFGELPEHTLKCQNILWSNVDQILLSYGDYYGNYYGLFYNHYIVK